MRDWNTLLHKVLDREVGFDETLAAAEIMSKIAAIQNVSELAYFIRALSAKSTMLYKSNLDKDHSDEFKKKIFESMLIINYVSAWFDDAIGKEWGSTSVKIETLADAVKQLLVALLAADADMHHHSASAREFATNALAEVTGEVMDLSDASKLKWVKK